MEDRDDSHALEAMRAFAERTLSRVSGSPLVGGNYVRLLKDAGENYPAWLDAIDDNRRCSSLGSGASFRIPSAGSGDPSGRCLCMDLYGPLL
jgi:hypothetical protein